VATQSVPPHWYDDDKRLATLAAVLADQHERYEEEVKKSRGKS
jgi:hypothetical protein